MTSGSSYYIYPYHLVAALRERESWIIGNLDKNPGLSIEDNAKMVEPGLEFAQPDFREALYKVVRGVINWRHSTTPTVRVRGRPS